MTIMSIASFLFDDAACSLLTFYTFRLLPCLNHPAQDCITDCNKELDTCCSIVKTDDIYNVGNCTEDQDLHEKCFNAFVDCKDKCGADAKASTKVTTDFDVEIEGPIVEEA